MLFLSVLAFILTVVLTGWIRYYAIKRKVMDIPNQRSSHTVPTARGGGLAIVITFALAAGYLYLTGQLSLGDAMAISATLLVAAIGFWDDHGHVPARWRFLTHFFAALLVLYFLHGLPAIVIPKPLDAFWGYLLGAIFLVWLLNLFNFMDGTDGLAGSESLFVSAALAGFLYCTDSDLYKVAALLTVASAGFLVWNWPKAKIFMGDVGSGFLGLLLGVLILLATRHSSVLFYCGLILLGVFVVDASYTLWVRFKTGQQWYAAHCSHTYQNAARRYGHLPVLLACWAINLFWLLPLAIVVFRYPAMGLIGLLLAYMPLIILAYCFGAGHPEEKINGS